MTMVLAETADGTAAQRGDGYARAIHEAGHAVVRVLTSLPIKYVTTTAEWKGESLSVGSVHHWAFPKSLRDEMKNGRFMLKLKDRVEREVVACYAGYIAESRVDENVEDCTWESDRRDIQSMLNLLIIINLVRTFPTGPPDMDPDDRIRTAYDGYLYAWTESYVHSPQIWAAIEAVAGELLRHKRVTGERVKELVGDTLARTLASPSRPDGGEGQAAGRVAAERSKRVTGR